MYRCKHFSIHGLVPPDVFNERQEKAWELLDERLLITLNRLRERYGPITVNNYYWGNDREWSGQRTILIFKQNCLTSVKAELKHFFPR